MGLLASEVSGVDRAIPRSVEGWDEPRVTQACATAAPSVAALRVAPIEVLRQE